MEIKRVYEGIYDDREISYTENNVYGIIYRMQDKYGSWSLEEQHQLYDAINSLKEYFFILGQQTACQERRDMQ